MVVAAALLFLLQTPDYSAEGAKALEEGKYEAAAESFSRAVAADPRDYYAHFNLAMAYSYLHRDAEGIAEYRQTLELKPGLYEAELNAAILLLRQKNPADALPLLEDAASQKAREFRPRLYLADAQLQTGMADQAVENYRLAAELDPQSATAELGWGRALARQGNLDQAAPHFRQAVARDPRYREALLELAALFEQNKQPAEALTIYREFPDNAAVQQHAGALLLEGQKFAEAVPRLEQAYQRAPNPASRDALISAYLLNHQIDKAVPLLEKGVAEEPSNYDLRMIYAGALRDRKQYPAAAAQFNQAAKIKPAEAKTWADLGGMLYMTGDHEHALDAFARARQLGDSNPATWYMTAIMLDAAHQLKPALAAYREFLAASQGKSPDQEFQARQRARIIQRELEKR